MTEIEENELICRILLRWGRIQETSHHMPYWRRSSGGEQLGTPSFTTWEEAGFILDAAANHSQKYPSAFPFWSCVGFDPAKKDWSAGLGTKSVEGSTGPLAIRAAALEYIKSIKE